MEEDTLNMVNMTGNVTVSYPNMTPINYTEYIINARMFSTQLMNYFGAVNLPPLPQFMMFDGDYNAWMARLEASFKNPATSDEDTIKMLVPVIQFQS